MTTLKLLGLVNIKRFIYQPWNNCLTIVKNIVYIFRKNELKRVKNLFQFMKEA